MSRTHPIEAESYRLLAQRVDLSRFEPLARVVVARVVHATADLEFAETMVVDDAAVRQGIAALRSGAAVVADVRMVASGITSMAVHCALADFNPPEGSAPTRSAAAMRAAAERHREGAIFVVGCAPTALQELVEAVTSGEVRPALVIGMPVGFVGAADAKEALLRSQTPAISNRGDKGGSAAAAAACNALVRLAQEA